MTPFQKDKQIIDLGAARLVRGCCLYDTGLTKNRAYFVPECDGAPAEPKRSLHSAQQMGIE